MKIIRNISMSIAAILLMALLSCTKNDEVRIVYRSTMAIAPYTVTWLGGDGSKTTETVEAESLQDVWQYSFMAERGDIVFITAKYDDPESSVLVQILIDGKIYKERSSTNDTTRYVTVSGTVPFD